MLLTHPSPVTRHTSTPNTYDCTIFLMLLLPDRRQVDFLFANQIVNGLRFSYFTRCRIWIEKTNRYDLLEKTNVHEERICQLHFEPSAFINESRNRLHQSAYPMLYLSNECDSTNDDMTFNGIPLSLFNVSSI